MTERRKFSCSLGTLLLVANAVCAAAEKYANQLNTRLPEGYTGVIRKLIQKVSNGEASQKKVTAEARR
jgi:hypothetical protein